MEPYATKISKMTNDLDIDNATQEEIEFKMIGTEVDIVAICDCKFVKNNMYFRIQLKNNKRFAIAKKKNAHYFTDIGQVMIIYTIYIIQQMHFTKEIFSLGWKKMTP